jgi:hypothetical protein
MQTTWHFLLAANSNTPSVFAMERWTLAEMTFREGSICLMPHDDGVSDRSSADMLALVKDGTVFRRISGEQVPSG